MSSGTFRISVITLPAFSTRSVSFSLSAAKLPVENANSAATNKAKIFFMIISSLRKSQHGTLECNWQVTHERGEPVAQQSIGQTLTKFLAKVTKMRDFFRLAVFTV